MRPPLAYFGGKQRIAEQIIEVFGEHRHYVEPYAGSLAVLLAKPASAMETVNDLDGELVTFWRVLRDRPEDLYRVCALTPHAVAELEEARSIPDDADEVEVARRVWVQLTQGRSATRRTVTGWRHYQNPATASTAAFKTYRAAYLDRLPPAAQRLLDVQLECRDALDVVADYGRHEGVLMYVDPPYLPSTRRTKTYKHEVDVGHHERLVDGVRRCRSKVVLSGYDAPLYKATLADWERVTIRARSQSHPAGSVARTEVLWCNFTPEQYLFRIGDVA